MMTLEGPESLTKFYLVLHGCLLVANYNEKGQGRNMKTKNYVSIAAESEIHLLECLLATICLRQKCLS